MRYLLLFAALLSITSCSHRMKPDHVSFTPSYECEIQNGTSVKHKPKISSTMDWNF